MQTKKMPQPGIPTGTEASTNLEIHDSTVAARVKSFCVNHLAEWMYQGKLDAAVLLAVCVWLVFGGRLIHE